MIFTGEQSIKWHEPKARWIAFRFPHWVVIDKCFRARLKISMSLLLVQWRQKDKESWVRPEVHPWVTQHSIDAFRCCWIIFIRARHKSNSNKLLLWWVTFHMLHLIYNHITDIQLCNYEMDLGASTYLKWTLAESPKLMPPTVVTLN